MNVLTTIMSRPVNGRAAAAVTQLNELAQAATDAGASRVNTMAMNVHPGRMDEAQERMIKMADLNVAAGAVQSRASMAISGMPGPHVFLTTAWGAYGDLDSGIEKIMSSPEMQAIRTSKDPIGTVVATFQAIPLG